MNILAIVVTFYPDRGLLENNISAFINDVDKVLIWENTPEDKKSQYRFIDNPKIEYCGDGVNSISHALNYAWKYAKANGYDYLLTMDQDSIWEGFNYFIKRTILDEKSPQGIWGPAIITDSKYVINDEYFYQTDITITSGMLIKTEVLNKLGGWNERFKVDCVDNEFCLKSKNLNIPIYQFRSSKTYLIQRYGAPRVVHFWKYSTTLRGDSAERLYSIFMNHIILFRLFPNYKSQRRDFKIYWINKIKWIFFFEEDRFKKLIAIIKGISAGLNCTLNEYYNYNSKEKQERGKDKLELLYDILIRR